jgi:hypothetical protein
MSSFCGFLNDGKERTESGKKMSPLRGFWQHRSFTVTRMPPLRDYTITLRRGIESLTCKISPGGTTFW